MVNARNDHGQCKPRRRLALPTRRNGIVRNRITIDGLRLEFEFRRERGQRLLTADPDSAHASQWADNVLLLLTRHLPTPGFAAPADRALSRQVVILYGLYEADLESGELHVHYKVRISRDDLRELHDRLAEDRRRWLHASAETTYLQRWRLELLLGLFPPALFDALALARPRGAKHQARELLRPVRVGLLMAERLVRQAAADAPTRQSLLSILGTDYPLSGPGWRAAAVKLVDRSFAGAWAKYGIGPPALRDASEVFAEYLPPAARARLLRALVGAEDAQDRWERRLLGAEGAGARDFELL